jgi:hypothetical protein
VACTEAISCVNGATTGYLEAPFAAHFFVVDRSLSRMSCDAEMSDSDSALSDIEISIHPEVAIVTCYAKHAKKPTDKAPLDERMYILLSSVQSLYDRRAKVTITHTPSTSDACEAYAQPVEKSIHRPIGPVRLTGFQQARQAFTLGLGPYRDCGPLEPSRGDHQVARAVTAF